jgi:hypothetical protein
MLFRIIGYLLAMSVVPCLFLLVRRHVTLRHSEIYNGTVVAHEVRNDRDSPYFALRVEYRDSQSQVHGFTTESAMNPPARKVGDGVMVFHYSDGSRPDIMVFEHLFLGYWTWLCACICVIGWLCAPAVMRALYHK